MRNVSFKVLEKSLNVLFRKGYEGVLSFPIEDACVARLLRDASFSWSAGKALMRVKILKTFLIFLDFAI